MDDSDPPSTPCPTPVEEEPTLTEVAEALILFSTTLLRLYSGLRKRRFHKEVDLPMDVGGSFEDLSHSFRGAAEEV